MLANVFHLTTHKQTELQWGLKTKQFWSDNVTEGRVGLQDRNAFFPSWCTQTHTSITRRKSLISNKKLYFFFLCVYVFSADVGPLNHLEVSEECFCCISIKSAPISSPAEKYLFSKSWLTKKRIAWLSVWQCVDFYFKLILRLLSCLYTLQSHI